MAKNQTYKAFSARPTHVMDLNGELLESAPILSQLAVEVRDISGYATYVARNDVTLKSRLAQITASAPAEAGRQAGITMPNFFLEHEDDEAEESRAPLVGTSGKSRKEKLIQYNAVTVFRSWQERVMAVNGESSKHVSQGWKRTMNASPPSYGEDFVNLGAVDSRYAVIENDPFVDGEIVLKLVIKGNWYRLIFPFNNSRFPWGR